MSELGRYRRYLPVLLGNYLARLGLSVLLAWPFVRVLQTSGIEQFPEGDRLLFEGGGLYLLELLRVSGGELGSLGRGTLLLLMPVAVFLLLVRALSLEALRSTEPPALGDLWSSALRRLPTFLLIAGVTLLVQVLTLGAASFAAGRLSQALGGSHAEVRGDVVFALCLLLGCALSLLLGAAAELGRAGVVQRGLRGTPALLHGLRVVRRRFGSVLLVWGGAALASVLLVLGAAWLAALCDVSKAGSLRPLAVFTLHQLVALALAFLHVVWLRGALALAGSEAQPPAASR